MSTKSNGFWSTANAAFTQAERDEYNRFRSDLYLAADRMRDRAHASDDAYTLRRANELMELVGRMPTMER